MDTTEIKEKVKEIMGIFGLKGSGVAKAMNITANVFGQKMSDKAPRNQFNQKNLNDLITYIKIQAEKL